MYISTFLDIDNKCSYFL